LARSANALRRSAAGAVDEIEISTCGRDDIPLRRRSAEEHARAGGAGDLEIAVVVAGNAPLSADRLTAATIDELVGQGGVELAT